MGSYNEFIKEVTKIVAIYNMRAIRISIEKNRINTDILNLKKKHVNFRKNSFV